LPARSSFGSATRLAILPAGAAAGLVAMTAQLGTDYPSDAEPAISSLARGDIHGFVSAPVQMGPLSVLLRAPVAALVGPDSIWAYRLGALVCLLALVALAALIAPRVSAGTGLLAALLLILRPGTVDALHLGHPEEPLGAALCVTALLLARDHPIGSGIVLGAALATKQWALIAIAPVLIAAAPAQRVRLAAVAAGVAALVIVPVAAADPHAFISALDHPAFGLSAMRTGNLWGFTAITETVPLGHGESTVVYLVPVWLQHVAHPLVAALTLGVGAAALRRRRNVDPLALFALLMLVRCALDPWNHAYYHAPFIVALIVWEVVEARRTPWLGALSAAWIGLVFHCSLPLSDVLYAVWALPMIGWLSLRAMRLEPGRASGQSLVAA
jgi:4-amino-4-deoxy-L-arabinose transferase-like glycosyltransferase